jgi:hypothetical protein
MSMLPWERYSERYSEALYLVFQGHGHGGLRVVRVNFTKS